MTSRVLQMWHRRTPSPSPRHLWAITSATTVDGVTAHVQIEFTLDAREVDGHPDVLDAATMDAVETVLRNEVSHRRVASLPMAGESIDWVPENLMPDATISNVFVISSDVQVTHELRRLVNHTAGP